MGAIKQVCSYYIFIFIFINEGVEMGHAKVLLGNYRERKVRRFKSIK